MNKSSSAKGPKNKTVLDTPHSDVFIFANPFLGQLIQRFFTGLGLEVTLVTSSQKGSSGLVVPAMPIELFEQLQPKEQTWMRDSYGAVSTLYASNSLRYLTDASGTCLALSGTYYAPSMVWQPGRSTYWVRKDSVSLEEQSFSDFDIAKVRKRKNVFSLIAKDGTRLESADVAVQAVDVFRYEDNDILPQEQLLLLKQTMLATGSQIVKFRQNSRILFGSLSADKAIKWQKYFYSKQAVRDRAALVSASRIAGLGSSTCWHDAAILARGSAWWYDVYQCVRKLRKNRK